MLRDLIIIVCLVVCTCTRCYSKEQQADFRRIFSHVVARHGDRTPLQPYATDPYRNLSSWHFAWSHLTNKGGRLEYALGQWLRQKYANDLLLNDKNTYNRSAVYVQSVSDERCVASAEFIMAGLYQYIPDENIQLRTIPENQDYVLGNRVPKPCHAYGHSNWKAFKKPQFKSVAKNNSDLYEYLSTNSGQNVTNIFDAANIYDTLAAEMDIKKILPDWTAQVFPGGRLEEISVLNMIWSCLTKKQQHFRSGFLLKDILDRSMNRSRAELNPNRKMWIYSTHDANLACLLNTMGLFNNLTVPYGASVMFDLWMRNDKPFIQISYKNETETPKPLNIRNCGTFCPFDKMYQLFKFAIPAKSFDMECNLTEMELSSELE